MTWLEEAGCECHSTLRFAAVLFARAPVVSLELFEVGTDRKSAALVRHDEPIQFRRPLGRGEARATHTSGIDQPTAACSFHHPSNLTVLLPSDITLFRHGDSGLVIAAQVYARRPRSQTRSGTPGSTVDGLNSIKNVVSWPPRARFNASTPNRAWACERKCGHSRERSHGNLHLACELHRPRNS
jgi:hypothetical protein